MGKINELTANDNKAKFWQSIFLNENIDENHELGGNKIERVIPI